MRCSIELAVGTPLERRWILSSSLFFVVRGHLWNSQGVKTLDQAFNTRFERLNARSSV
ncbi:hypothetical protein PGT21_023170 [Puccinia graminis f. sp. tritici]|uniref:Uncharacterized protein n=1 Tax=Puccinia graminis f. sp. tritici TaxID=56615 RepID=A0A5B0ND45_PUCGR|nr:hypothetical protein PGT21_023170 [Puccinia graminis f. sp. tritici]